jgi:hypothetical protein
MSEVQVMYKLTLEEQMELRDILDTYAKVKPQSIEKTEEVFQHILTYINEHMDDAVHDGLELRFTNALKREKKEFKRLDKSVLLSKGPKEK